MIESLVKGTIMILRRFMQHVREQNWLAVVIDVLVVFGSVVLATQFSEGIDSRRAQDALTSAMSRVSRVQAV
jgi:hypothetical protein